MNAKEKAIRQALNLAQMELRSMYKRTGIKGSNILDIVDEAYEHFNPQPPDQITAALNEIENAMERWIHGRFNDDEALNAVKDALFKVGRLTFFMKKETDDTPE